MSCFIKKEQINNSLSNCTERKEDSMGKKKPSSFYNINYKAGLDDEKKHQHELLSQVPSNRPESYFLSEYRDKFSTNCKFLAANRKEMFEQLFKNYGYSSEFLKDYQGIMYDRNHFDTLDLAMNPLKKGSCSPIPRKVLKGKDLPKMELTAATANRVINKDLKEKSHTSGNKTDCKQWMQVSEYKAEFTCSKKPISLLKT